MAATISEFLGASEQIISTDRRTFNGFSGLHGGLAVAKLIRQMRTQVPCSRELVSVTARFIRPLVWPILLDVAVVKSGTLLTVVYASASSEAGTCVETHAIFGIESERNLPVFAPEMPTGIVDPSDTTALVFPAEFVPIFERMEIRPATDGLPYSGSADPVLCGWVRLRDDVPANEERITILIDSLAPSYTAVLTELKAVPTVEMSVQLSAGAADVTFDWVLVRASTTSADARGFVRETIDMWTECGQHLASCSQLRIAL